MSAALSPATIMIAEKAADMIRGSARSPAVAGSIHLERQPA
jgi:hypothetical protein